MFQITKPNTKKSLGLELILTPQITVSHFPILSGLPQLGEVIYLFIYSVLDPNGHNMLKSLLKLNFIKVLKPYYYIYQAVDPKSGS